MTPAQQLTGGITCSGCHKDVRSGYFLCDDCYTRPHTPAPEQTQQPDKCGVTYCGIQSGMCAFLPEKQKCPLLTQNATARAATLAAYDKVKEELFQNNHIVHPDSPEGKAIKRVIKSLRQSTTGDEQG
jgi:hypothetical protein